MIKGLSKLFRSSPFGQGKPEASRKKGCKAFRELKDWQIRKYRIAVDENKWYMGERLNRNIDWTEAELDFLHNEYYGCALEWRNEYCSDLCQHFSSCNLGQNFCENK